jgi:hypothetical protein
MQDTYQKIEIGIWGAYDVFCKTNAVGDCADPEADMRSGMRQPVVSVVTGTVGKSAYLQRMQPNSLPNMNDLAWPFV